MSPSSLRKNRRVCGGKQYDGQIDITFTSQYVQLTLKGALLFDSGKTEIRAEAVPVVDKVGRILENYAGNVIEIEGHTDNVPMHSAKYANNSELSCGRALAVYDYLISTTNLDPSKSSMRAGANMFLLPTIPRKREERKTDVWKSVFIMI